MTLRTFLGAWSVLRARRGNHPKIPMTGSLSSRTISYLPTSKLVPAAGVETRRHEVDDALDVCLRDATLSRHLAARRGQDGGRQMAPVVVILKPPKLWNFRLGIFREAYGPTNAPTTAPELRTSPDLRRCDPMPRRGKLPPRRGRFENDNVAWKVSTLPDPFYYPSRGPYAGQRRAFTETVNRTVDATPQWSCRSILGAGHTEHHRLFCPPRLVTIRGSCWDICRHSRQGLVRWLHACSASC